MSTSDKELKQHLKWNTAGVVFLVIFGAVYELFGHEVYSYHMIYAFAFSLFMGTLPYMTMLLNGKHPAKEFLKYWSSAIAVLSVGSVIQGVLDIYGTTNWLVILYPAAGLALIAAALLSCRHKPIRDASGDP